MIVTKAILEKLIADDRIAFLIKILLALDVGDRQLRNNILALSARFTRYERTRHSNIESSSNLRIEINQIEQSALYIISKISDNTLETNINNMENKTLQELVQQLYTEYGTEKQEKIAHAKKEKEMKELIAASIASLHDVVVNLKEGALRYSGLPVAQFLGSMVMGLFGKSKKSEKLINAVEKEGELQLTTTEFEDEVLEIAKNNPQVTELLNKLYNSRVLEKIQTKAALIAIKSKEIKGFEKRLPNLTDPTQVSNVKKSIKLLDMDIEDTLNEIREIFEENGLSL